MNKGYRILKRDLAVLDEGEYTDSTVYKSKLYRSMDSTSRKILEDYAENDTFAVASVPVKSLLGAYKGSKAMAPGEEAILESHKRGTDTFDSLPRIDLDTDKKDMSLATVSQVSLRRLALLKANGLLTDDDEVPVVMKRAKKFKRDYTPPAKIKLSNKDKDGLSTEFDYPNIKKLKRDK